VGRGTVGGASAEPLRVWSLGNGEGRRSPSPYWGLGLCPQKNFQKINVEIVYSLLQFVVPPGTTRPQLRAIRPPGHKKV